MKKYFKFSGRAPRSEMWMVTLIVSYLPIIPLTLLSIMSAKIFPSLTIDESIDAIMLISTLPFYPIFFATLKRRLHDLNLSGWWVFVPFLGILLFSVVMLISEKMGGFQWWMWVFVPLLIGSHLLLMFGMFAVFIGKGSEGPNDFGPDPLKS